MINVADIVNDPFAAQNFTIIRSTGAWVAGVWTNTPTNVPAYGSIQVANAKDLEIVPEADRVGGEIKIYCTQPIYQTRVDDASSGTSGLSDIILWQGDQYRVTSDAVWSDFGYYKAIAARTKGA